MEKDMHYYATYAMARAAGIDSDDAAVIAYAAQFVDDSTGTDNEKHKDKGMFFGVTTAHTLTQSARDVVKELRRDNEVNQRRMWVPFHFFPGGKGETFEEKILCVKDSAIVREMLANHLSLATKKSFILELIGISAHVYMDTFSHYGFSGMQSNYNALQLGSIKLEGRIDNDVEEIGAQMLAEAAKHLGHLGGAKYPDYPYLKWRFIFKKDRPENGNVSKRDNPKTFLEGCKKLHSFFHRFAKKYYAESPSDYIEFSAIESDIKDLLSNDGSLEDRCRKWKESLATGAPDYDPNVWERDKNLNFERFGSSSDGIDTPVYRFHQAAAYHRFYVLKDLLPSHGIAVY